VNSYKCVFTVGNRSHPFNFLRTEKEWVAEKVLYIRLFHHEGSTKSVTDKNIKVTGQGQEVCTRT